MAIRFGPGGLGGIDEAVSNLEEFARLGLRACEIEFTYGVYIKDRKIAEEIGRKARELDIRLSIHAPYYVNLNSEDKSKTEASKKRVLDCCRVADWLGADRVVFHPGFFGKIDKEVSYQNIKKEIIEMGEEIKKNGWKVELAPETAGKLNVFGSVDEILRLVEETGCKFTIDFAHLFARSQGKQEYREMYEKVKNFDRLHCHFSGINYTDKGEKSHKLTPEAEIRKLLEALPKNKEIVIINESPDPVGDSVKSLKIYNRNK